MRVETNPMKWLKLWTEARNDGKLRCLSDYQHRAWFRLLCFAAEQDPPGMVRASWKVLAAECADGAVEALKEAVTELDSLQLVSCVTCNENEVQITFTSFEKRQSKYPSDDRKRVNERVRKHREERRLRQPDADVTRCNELKRPETTQKKNTEEERKTPHNPPRGERFVLPDWIAADDWDAFVEMRQKIRKPMTDKAKSLTVSKLDSLRRAGHPPDEVLKQSVMNSWQGVFPVRDRERQPAPLPVDNSARYVRATEDDIHPLRRKPRP